MIRYKNETFDDYFIDPVTAVITDKYGIIQHTRFNKGRPMFNHMPIHCVQMHTAYGYKLGYEIHHIDKNTLNNSLANLVYLTKDEHRKIHNIGKKHSNETKRKIGVASKGRLLGCHWWNNGITTKLGFECPGEGWVRRQVETLVS